MVLHRPSDLKSAEKTFNTNRVQNQCGYTILLLAIDQQNEELVHHLLQAGANPNAGHGIRNDGLPLLTALQGAMHKIVHHLLDHQVDLTVIARRPNVIYDLLTKGHLELVKTLLQKGVNVNICGTSAGYTGSLLITAISSCKDQIIPFLLEANINVNAVDFFHQNALHHAVLRRDVSLVRVLLNHGVHINREDMSGKYPLEIAIHTDHYPIASLLTLHKADHFVINNSEFGNALQVAISTGNQRLIDLTMAAGANINNVNEKGMSVLDSCLLAFKTCTVTPEFCARIIRLMRSLIEKGAKINDMHNKQYLPDFVYAYISESVLQSLVDLGFKIKFKSSYRDFRHPLHSAIMNRHKGVFTSLIHHHGIDVNSTDNLGNTCIHFCAYQRKVDDIKWLLKSFRIDLNHKNSSNATALRACIQFGIVSHCFKYLITKCSAVTIYDCYLCCITDCKTYYVKWIVKYVAMQEHLFRSMSFVMFQFHKSPPAIKRYYKKCVQEIERSKSEEIAGTKISKILMMNKLCHLVRNEHFINAFEQADLSEDYPIYNDILEYKVRRAFSFQTAKLRAMIHICKRLRLQFESESLIYEEIFDYLGDSDFASILSV